MMNACLVPSPAPDVVERGVQDGHRRAGHRCGEDERATIVDDVLTHDGGCKEDGYGQVRSELRASDRNAGARGARTYHRSRRAPC